MKKCLALSAFAAFGISLTGAQAGNPENKMDAFEKTGGSENCLMMRQVKESDPLTDDAILFEISGGRLFLNELNGTCSNLVKEGRFSYRTPQTKICKGDIISVTNEFGMFLGSCSLGDFYEVETPAS